MKNGFLEYKSTNWTVKLPNDWIVEEHKECLSFYGEHGIGALQISAYSKDEIVTLEDLKEFAQDEVPKEENIESVIVGSYFGLQVEYEYKKTFWRMWFLARDKVFLYVTYNCDFEERKTERDKVSQIIDSLK